MKQPCALSFSIHKYLKGRTTRLPPASAAEFGLVQIVFFFPFNLTVMHCLIHYLRINSTEYWRRWITPSIREAVCASVILLWEYSALRSQMTSSICLGESARRDWFRHPQSVILSNLKAGGSVKKSQDASLQLGFSLCSNRTFFFFGFVLFFFYQIVDVAQQN